jgi:hypothetical protein
MPSLGLGISMVMNRGGATRGPELVGTPAGTGWTATGTGASVSAGNLVFTAANNLADCHLTIVSKDNTTYEVKWTIQGRTGGTARVIVYGATTAHAGASGNRSVDGNYVETVVTSAAGSNALRITVQATGTSGTNTFNVTSVSVKEVLR